ncbi:hypothetical protein FAEPRAM212_00262 [Faecalibacterium prausnitzii M21/2]|uniref:Uncharacterized protein n=1 Tax=Faecalibacterium prausnitzii M21/2 TaxID=411485 RepID=A8S6P1_9FIRM|nr:hypothetical protein FAEPRAM212_00262 [Faecalibacterium prausnitzii M21/2]
MVRRMLIIVSSYCKKCHCHCSTFCVKKGEINIFLQLAPVVSCKVDKIQVYLYL